MDMIALVNSDFSLKTVTDNQVVAICLCTAKLRDSIIDYVEFVKRLFMSLCTALAYYSYCHAPHFVKKPDVLRRK